jgi:hypothetical protein
LKYAQRDSFRGQLSHASGSSVGRSKLSLRAGRRAQMLFSQEGIDFVTGPGGESFCLDGSLETGESICDY